MKKKYLIIIGFILLIILIIITLFRPQTKPSTTIPTATPSATIQPTIATGSAVLQTPNDQIYSQAVKTLVQKYPWYPKLPIETADFRIIYDFNKESFRIRLLSQSTDEIKQTAIEKLKAIGVDLSKFTYYFIEP